MNKVNEQHSKPAYIGLTNEKQEKETKSITSSKKKSISPKNRNKTPDKKQLHERKTDVQCYKDICDQMKTDGSRVAQMCLDKITSSEDRENEDVKKLKNFFGELLQSIKLPSIKGAVVNSVITTNLKDLPKVLREKPEQLLILGSRFAASDWFIKKLEDIYSSDKKAARLLKAADIPCKIKIVIYSSQKSEETINEQNVQKISKNILNAAKQILPIMRNSSPMIKKLQMGKTLETIQKNLPSEKDCPAVAEKLVKELLQIANLHLKQPKSRPDDDLLKKILAKAAEILQNNK